MAAEINNHSQRLHSQWSNDPRWSNIKRTYSGEQVLSLRQAFANNSVCAKTAAKKLWAQLNQPGLITFSGTRSAHQAQQQQKAGASLLYLAGWQVAADQYQGFPLYNDFARYPVNSIPGLIKQINQLRQNADQQDLEMPTITQQHCQPSEDMLPIIADAEVDCSGILNAYELMQSFIEAGVAGVHFEDQLVVLKQSGHNEGRVMLPTREAVQKLVAARLAADVADSNTVIFARCDADNARLITNNSDPADAPFLTGQRNQEGYYHTVSGINQAIARGLAYAPYADVLWLETSRPDLSLAAQFARAIHKQFPGKILAYNCANDFNWHNRFNPLQIAMHQKHLSALGYKLLFTNGQTREMPSIGNPSLLKQANIFEKLQIN